MKKEKAVSRNVIVAIVAVIIIVGVAVALLQFFVSPPPGTTGGKTWTINIYIGVNSSVGGGNPQNYGRYLIVQLPTNATIKVGDTVQIVLHNNDTFPNPHVFTIQVGSTSVNSIQAAAQSTGSITFKVSQSGTYTISCQIYCGAYHLDVGKMQQVKLFTAS